MIFKYDVYISFTEEDQNSSSGLKNTWVSNFQKFLETLLTQLAGEKINIITSEDVKGKDFNPFKECCTIIYILSPDFISSTESQQELYLLNNLTREEKSQIHIKSFPRVFKVIKSYVPIENHPSSLRMLNSYDLFYYDTFTGAMKEFSAFFGQEAEKSYWTRLVDLSYDIFKTISSSKETGLSKKNKESRIVYLASSVKELALHRDLIKIDLEHHGYTILPKSTLSVDDTEIEQNIIKDIKNSDFYIQLLGESFIQEKDNKLMQLENELISKTVEVTTDINGHVLNRLVWIPFDLKFQNEKDKNDFEDFRLSSETLRGADVLQMPLEDFKTILRKRLSNTESEAKHLLNVGLEINEAGKSLYFIVDKMDYQAAQPIIKSITAEGVRVVVPQYDGELLEVRSKHQANLNSCDAVMLYTNNVSEQWLKSKVLDVLKAPGFGRKKTFSSKIVLVNNAAIVNEDYYNEHRFKLFKYDGNMNEEVLQSVLRDIK